MYRNRLSLPILLVSLMFVGAGCGSSVSINGTITNFDECAAAGNPIMESYPRQCRANGVTFVENVEPPVKIPDTIEPTTKPSENTATPVSLGETFSLTRGQSRMLKDAGLRVTLLEINDSRCKPDVQCIWAGELTAHLRIEGPGTEASVREVTLGTVRNTTVQESGYRFELKDASETSVQLVVTK